MSLKYDLSKILPHDTPMIFIDELLDVNIDENTVKASVTITENKILYDRSIQGISSISGIEFMAQTVGCFAYFKNHQTEPKIGFLLGSRLYKTSIEKFELGKTYIITASQVFEDNELVSFDCFIYNNNEECAKATVNVYQPQDAEKINV